ncbi:MAG: hypothetical protein ACRDSL_10585 [Pseudonocardiaceae bacterium]
MTDPNLLDDGDQDCPGCRDCLRYCPKCVRVAAEYSAGGQPDLSAPEDGDEDRPMGWVLVGECPHPVAGGPAFHVGSCRECDAAQRRQRRKDLQVSAPGPGPGGEAR